MEFLLLLQFVIENYWTKTLGCHIKAYENSQLKELIDIALGKQIIMIEYLTM